MLKGVDIELREGEIVSLLGPKGAGKSTLLGVLSGLLPASAGTVERHGRVALAVPQAPRRTVRASLELALAWWRVAPHERPARVAAALAALGLDPDRLAADEPERVELARALVLRADTLLLDLPLNPGLIAEASAALRAASRATLAVVPPPWALGDRALVLLNGCVAAEGPPRELLERPPTAEVARFVGFDGELRSAGEVLLTRPAHVHLGGDLEATVTRVVALGDGLRVELALPTGRLYAAVPIPGPALGERVRVRIAGGVRYSLM